MVNASPLDRRAKMIVSPAEAKEKRIPVWNEFLDIFEVPRLLPDIILEFSIDIISGSTLI